MREEKKKKKKRNRSTQRHLTCKTRLHNLSISKMLYMYVQKSHGCDEQMYDDLGHAGVVKCVHIYTF